MKVAVFDHQLNPGGGMRFMTNLVINLKKVKPQIEIVVFCNKHKINGLGIVELLEHNHVKVQQLNATLLANKPNGRLKRVIKFLLKKIGISFAEINEEGELLQEIEENSKQFDIAYFPWPYLIPNVKIHCPKVATFHDFNFQYFWGAPVFSEQMLDSLNLNINNWLSDTTPVVSTNFMKSELQNFYPKVKNVHVVHLSSLNIFQDVKDVNNNFEKFNFLKNKPYIICPVHMTVHKNIGNIIAAASIVNNSSLKVRFLFTGSNSAIVNGKSNYLGLDIGNMQEQDVFGLGYITDSEMNFLLRNAFAVLNASLYEAGNGIGLDAWPIGIPVIQSNIPAFQEHIELQSYKAFTFDPRDPNELANAIVECLNNKDLRKEYVEASLVASQKFKWSDIASQYLSIFENQFK